MLEDLHSSPIPSVTSQKCSGSIASIQAVFVSVLVQVFLWQGLATKTVLPTLAGLAHAR